MARKSIYCEASASAHRRVLLTMNHTKTKQTTMKTTLTLATLGLTASIASATLVAQKTYDSGVVPADFGFEDGATSNNYLNEDGKIDGANSLGLFGTGSYVDYSTVNTYNTAGQVVTVNFKFRADSFSSNSRKATMGSRLTMAVKTSEPEGWYLLKMLFTIFPSPLRSDPTNIASLPKAPMESVVKRWLPARTLPSTAVR